MKECDNLESRNQEEILQSDLENCDENSTYCVNGGCYKKCNGKWYKFEYFDPLGTMDDLYMEIYEDEPPERD